MVTRQGRGKRQEIEQTWALGVLGEPVFDRVLLLFGCCKAGAPGLRTVWPADGRKPTMTEAWDIADRAGEGSKSLVTGDEWRRRWGNECNGNSFSVEAQRASSEDSRAFFSQVTVPSKSSSPLPNSITSPNSITRSKLLAPLSARILCIHQLCFFLVFFCSLCKGLMLTDWIFFFFFL